VRCRAAAGEPPNARGEYSLGLGVEYLAPALESARAVVAEVNDRVPWTFTHPLLKRADFDLLIETSRPPVELTYGVLTDVEKQIAQNAAGLVPEGATIECGIGALPNAIVAALQGRKLGYYSGVICDAGAPAAGALLRRRADGNAGAFRLGRRESGVRLGSSDETHGAAALARIERFVAINAAVEVDFTGQVNAELARGSYVARSAARSTSSARRTSRGAACRSSALAARNR